MAIYKKKPPMIEAFRLGIDYIPDWFMDKVTTNEIILHGQSSGFDHYEDTNCDIKTSDGVYIHANYGDYIIKESTGEIYACREKIFNETYELVE